MDFRALAEATNNPHVVKRPTKGARVEKVIRIIRKDAVHTGHTDTVQASQPGAHAQHV